MDKSKQANFLRRYFIAGLAAGAIGAAAWRGVLIRGFQGPEGFGPVPPAIDSKYGAWLAAQHAIYVDDFEKAAHFMGALKDVKSAAVLSARDLVMFLETGDARNIEWLRKGNAAVYRIVSAANSVAAGKWKPVYNEFKNEKGITMAPFRIWAGVAVGGPTAAARAAAFIDSIEAANDSWKNFAKAAVYAATGNPKTARKHFAAVPPAFMNLGDYHLAMSFHKKFGFEKDAATLRQKWTSSPGGMYMAALDIGADWSLYDSPAKMLAAALIQNVSHGGEGGFSDSSLLMLRAAAAMGGAPDSVNYYTGGYFYAAGSDNYKKYWAPISDNPIYAPFIDMKNAEKAGKSGETIQRLNRILQKSPLFMPAIIKVWKKNMQNGRDYDAIRMLTRALIRPNLPSAGRAYLLRLRGHSFYMSGRFEDAEQDLAEAATLTPMDAGIMGLQARVWAVQKNNLDEAYRFSISLIKAFPGNVENWNVLAAVVAAKEGWEPALEILERVGRVAEECSELFLRLGDLRLKAGLKIGAAAAYRKAIALSDDGFVVKSEVERKIRRVER